MEVRLAKPSDAAGACAVLRRSIEVLCFADHDGDPVTLDLWLANKTPANVLSWIDAPAQRVLIAVEAGAILGVGAASASGEILLNYVSPDARFRGVSKALLGELEAFLRGQANAVVRLSSTRTAHRFYRAAGYEDCGPPETWGRMRPQPMRKRL